MPFSHWKMAHMNIPKLYKMNQLKSPEDLTEAPLLVEWLFYV